ncbi:winged helix-turn-helix transcriptional regulator [Actinomadura soli]|uniref:Winged helix-turn-helix transcriptional regulator n=1 Tax=Actinomadura soli TaxID=2508997 RepID=A0A5C4J6Z6_9ACTN|nr:MarR family winged helix-turn-helix transcriptional regulator [Actinomadura soli]TMQ93658.1 winged helix-turn-helix transcriptional regulator [Actinomadura soli]
MSTPDTTEDTVRELLLVMPRLVGRVKRLPLPERLRSLDLAPRHLSMLSLLLLDGPLTVSQLAKMLNVAPTTVSLIVSDLSRKGVLVRQRAISDHTRWVVTVWRSVLWEHNPLIGFSLMSELGFRGQYSAQAP